jgi:predicted transcriptional regulator
MEQTSLEAFQAVKPSLSRRQAEVLEVLPYIEPATAQMIARCMDRLINTVDNRVGELGKKGKIEVAHVGPCGVTGENARFWKVKR